MLNRHSPRRAGPRARAAVAEPLELRTLFAGAGPLVVSEFLADNTIGLGDEDRERSDWIEIHNPTGAPVDAGGYFLTDDAAAPQKWRLPAVTVPAGGYLVVFASDKDRSGPQLHTNFKLAAEGEYLGLVRPDGVTVSDAYAPRYPEQLDDVSYGVLDGAERYFTTPTPGAPNENGATGVVADTVFSVDRGFYDSPFELRIATTTPGATVRYTTDGTRPTATTGTAYAGPITISRTTALRAAAFKPGMVPSDVDTHTYIFLDDVVRQSQQSALDAGFPQSWGTTGSDYAMDGDVIGPNGTDKFGGIYAATIREDLKSIPTMSIVLPVEDMFGATGIYANTSPETGERATSVELIDPAGGPGAADREFQADAGIQIQGGAFRSHQLTRKHSLRLLFKDRYGQSQLRFPLFGPDATDTFDTVVLRAEANDGWSWNAHFGQPLYARDVWAREAQRDMGHPSSDGARVHLYINGLYWGLYNPSERPDAAFAAAYYGGDKDDWDAINSFEPVDGDLDAWDTLMSLARDVPAGATEAEKNAAYHKLQGNNPDGSDNPGWQDYLDVDNFIDYVLLNTFIGNTDWGWHNWFAARLRADDGVGTDATGFKFLSWDAEFGLGLVDGLTANAFGGTGPLDILNHLRSSSDFSLRFADRVRMHMFDGGALTTEANKARLREITGPIDRAIVAESARWGDQHNAAPYTRAHWAAARDRLLANDGYFERRRELFFLQLGPNFFPQTRPPIVTPAAGPRPPGGSVLLGGIGTGTGGTGTTIYYTVDGSDPRLPDGAVNPAARSFDAPVTVLVPASSTWQYLDNGVDPGTAWRAPGFNDSAWKSGAAPFGFGDNTYFTPLARQPTTYYRTAFDVTDPSRHGPLRLRLRRDDGAVVYLNGHRVVASNMNVDAPYGHTTPSTADGVTTPTVEELEEQIYFTYTVDPALLVPGRNVIAAELHQAARFDIDGGFALELAAAAPHRAVALPPGIARLRARARGTTGVWSALADATYHVDAPATAANVLVTEVNYHPHDPDASRGETVSPDPGDYEFVELMNPSRRRVSLAGVRFVLGVKLAFPDDAYLDPGERAVVVRNLAAFRSRYGDGPRVLGTFTGSLGNDGQLTVLKDARGDVVSSFRYGDSGRWPVRADGRGSTLEMADPTADPADPGNWRPSAEYGGTPGAAGAGSVPGVVVNEVFANSTPAAADRIELFNPTPHAADLGGWYLSDDSANFRAFRIPDGTTLAPGAYVVFDESALGFALDDAGGDVWLTAGDPATGRLTRFVDHVEFGAAPESRSWGRWPDGSPGASFYPTRFPRPGHPNAGPVVGPVVISEIMYAPAAGGQEYVELRHSVAAAMPLAGWRFTSGIDYAFPDDAVIPAFRRLLLVGGDPAAFRAANNIPADVPVLGPFSLEGFVNVLDNAGEALALARPGDVPGTWYEVDRVRYGNAAPWPATAAGASLSRVDPSAWGDAASNWANEAGGSPGRANFGGAPPRQAVFARHAFDNNSLADGRSAAPGHFDDYALAPARALLPGERASGANVTNFTRGINGVMVDVTRLADNAFIVASDFELRVGDGTNWSAALIPASVTVRRGAGTGGADRVTLTLPDYVARNTWLRVTVKVNANTGLTSPDVFYFGNLVGDTGGGGTPVVNAIDLARTRFNLGRTTPAALAASDFNRDGRVNAVDVVIARGNQGRRLPLFTAPAALSPAARPGPAGLWRAGPDRATFAPPTRRAVWDELVPDPIA